MGVAAPIFRTLSVLLVLAVSAGAARADVVTFVRLGQVTAAVPGNRAGVAVGDPVWLEPTLDRDLVLGRTPTPDGIGDACQCGDVSGDGSVSLLGISGRSRMPLPMATCDVDGDGRCGPEGARAVLRALIRRTPLEQRCAAAGAPRP